MNPQLCQDDNSFKAVSFDKGTLKAETQTLFTDTLVNFETEFPPTYLDNADGLSEHLFGRDVLTEILGGTKGAETLPGYAEMKSDLEAMAGIMDEQDAAYFRIVSA